MRAQDQLRFVNSAKPKLKYAQCVYNFKVPSSHEAPYRHQKILPIKKAQYSQITLILKDEYQRSIF
jgi:hypothetical protein